MLEKIKTVATWPVVALFVAGLTAFVLIAIFAPPEVRTALFGAHGLLFTILGWLSSSPLSSGSDSKPPDPPASPPT